jgi:DNA-binding transcriptional ArsR family regulator
LYNIDVKDEETRIKILKLLHSFYKDKPANFLKTEVVVNQIGEEDREVLSHLNYLLDAGYIEGKKFKTFEGDGYLEKIKITRKGINIVKPPSALLEQEKSVLIDTMIANLVTNVIEEVERADMSDEEKKGLVEEINKFLTNPYIAPFVGAALLKLMESA